VRNAYVHAMHCRESAVFTAIAIQVCLELAIAKGTQSMNSLIMASFDDLRSMLIVD